MLRCIVSSMQHFLAVYREGEAEGTFPASRVLSSQISGYDGREVDSRETVEMIFPINVSMYLPVTQVNA